MHYVIYIQLLYVAVYFVIASNQTVEPQHHITEPSWPQMAITIPIAKSHTTKLQEYCQRIQLNDPVYTVVPAQNGGGFYSTITIAGKSYTGDLELNEEEARESAATEVAVQLLRLSEYMK